MLDLIESIPGPVFLAVYLFYAVAVILIMKKLAAGNAGYSGMPVEPTSLSPVELSILGNGTRGAVVTAVFSLWEKGLVDVSSEDGKVKIIPKKGDRKGLNSIESSIYDRASGTDTFLKDLTGSGFAASAENITAAERGRLVNLGLLPDIAMIDRHRNASAGAVILLIVFGGIKLFLGISNEKPVTFLLILMVISVIAAVFMIRKKSMSATESGKRLLERSRTRFSHLNQAESGKSVLSNKDLLYGAALFGISGLAGGAILGELGDVALLDKGLKSSSGTGSGCASCSGGCSGDGGSGDGCGGGCGGCGGD